MPVIARQVRVLVLEVVDEILPDDVRVRVAADEEVELAPEVEVKVLQRPEHLLLQVPPARRHVHTHRWEVVVLGAGQHELKDAPVVRGS